MIEQYYYAIDEKRAGPIPFADLRELATKGELKRRATVWCRGMKEWQPAESVAQLFEGLPPDFEPEAQTPPRFPLDEPKVATMSQTPKPVTEPAQPGNQSHTGVPSIGKILAILGIVACLMVVFPPIQSYHAPVVFDPGYAGGGRNPNYADVNPMGYGQPAVLVDAGGFGNKSLGFLLTLGESDKIVVSQLVLQIMGIAVVGLAVVLWKGSTVSHLKA